MTPTEPNRRKNRPTVSTVEPSSWWPFVAIVLGAVGSYGVLVVHLLLEATSAGPWGLLWMAVPTAFIAAAGVALLMGSGMSPRDKRAHADNRPRTCASRNRPRRNAARNCKAVPRDDRHRAGGRLRLSGGQRQLIGDTERRAARLRRGSLGRNRPDHDQRRQLPVRAGRGHGGRRACLRGVRTRARR